MKAGNPSFDRNLVWYGGITGSGIILLSKTANLLSKIRIYYQKQHFYYQK
jgi:hypothetical protein